MGSQWNNRWLAAGLLTAACLASGARAQAQTTTCSSDTDCDKGLTCQAVGATACAGATACEPGKTCPAPEPCTPTELKECVPGPCKTDADCATDMVCYTQKSEQCSGGGQTACSKEPCPSPEPPTCQTITTQECTPRYLLPCTVAADCGDHFTCVETQECGCSGSSGSGSGSSGSADPGGAGASGTPKPLPAALDAGAPTTLDSGPADGGGGCSCKPSGVKRCEAEKIDCTSATNCPDKWTCVQEVRGAVACTAPADGGDPSTCVQVDAGSVTQSGTCMPPYARIPDSSSSKGGVSQDLGTGAAGSTSAAPTANSGHASDAGVASGNAATGQSKSSGGICSVSSVGQRSGTSSALVLLALVGLGIAARRRRQSALR